MIPQRASGTFEVSMEPQGESDQADGAVLGRMSLDKRFLGDLQATGKGEMLAARTGLPSSAAYVAIERVTGALNGMSGSFVLVHKGVMTQDAQDLLIEVVPDSGSGELAGIAGRLGIRIEAGQHYYDFECTLPVQR